MCIELVLRVRAAFLWYDEPGAADEPKEEQELQAWALPATFCLVNPNNEATVEKAFGWIQELSETLRRKYNLENE